MNLVYFIRLLFKNVLLIFGVGILMAGLVYLFTLGQPRTYTSSTTIYTGIATGYDIESGSNARFDLFANNAQFDNLINIIKSREAQEKTAIRLMAQHLILSKPDPRFCQAETWKSLMSEIPVEIKRMVENSYTGRDEPVAKAEIRQPATESPASAAAAMESRVVTRKVKRYHVDYTYYTIRAGDSPNGVCQKFGITPEELKKLNSPMPPFNGGQRLVVGTSMVPYEADTLVTEMVRVKEPAQTGFAGDQAESTHESLPAAGIDSPDNPVFTPDIVAEGNLWRYERLVNAMTDFKDADQDNYLFNTLQSSNPFYSVQKISSVKVTRIQSSDLVKLTFESNDPAVSMQTLKILTDVFRSQYRSITAKQTGLVSDYFRERVNAAKKQLDSLESSLLQFRMKNRIINYDEQTKFISEQKETLDRDWYEEAGKYSAAKTALALTEQNLGEKGKSIFQNTSVLEKRKQVYDLAMRISMAEIELLSGDPSDSTAQKKSDAARQEGIVTVQRWRGELEALKLDLNTEILKSFELNRTVQGLDIQTVLQKWLEKAIEVEESHARYNTLTERKNAFLKKYDEFAPLGSQLNKIDREIDLAQQDYMNHLNNLNQSIMKQKNVEQTEIQIIDNPVYPIKPNSSKRMITVIAAFMAGLMLTASMIILLEFLDTSIKFPDRLAQLSGLKVIGAFPRIPETPDHKVNFPLISSRAIDQITQRIRLEDIRRKSLGDQPFILFFISTREREGKTFLATRAVEKLRASGSKVLYIKQLDVISNREVHRQFDSFDQPAEAWDFEYAVPDNFISIRNVNELLRNYTFLTKGYQFLVIELPALLVQEFPAALAQSGSLSLLVATASRSWNHADDEGLRLFRSSVEHPVMALLNGCHVDQVEFMIGEIPKRRNWLRKFVKKVVNLNFKTAQT